MLTCRRVRDVEGLDGWTVVKGRVKVFEGLRKVVGRVLGYDDMDDRDDDMNEGNNEGN